MLEKPAFDCNKLGDFYDCGCGDEEEQAGEGDLGNKHKTTRDDDVESDMKSSVEIYQQPLVHPLSCSIPLANLHWI